MNSGGARPFEVKQKADRTRRIALFETVEGIVKEADLTGYTGKYVASHLLEDPPSKARIVIEMVIVGDPKNGIISFEFANLPKPNGTNQDAFDGFEEITLFDAALKRIPISLPEWAGKEDGAFKLLPTRVE